MLELLAVAAAGAAAGASNAIAGAGSLITFPTMVALGLPPLSANVTNTVGIVPASIGGALGYADLLREQRRRFARFLVPMLIGAVFGTGALLLTSEAAFEAIVPVLIAASCLLLFFQPRLTRRISHAGNERSPFLVAGILFCGAYGAYFGSAVSILLFAILALFVSDSLQHLNGLKILLIGCANLLAAVAYAFLAPVEWRYAVTIMVFSFVGGRVGAHYARRIPSDPLRISIAGFGLAVAAVLAVRSFGCLRRRAGRRRRCRRERGRSPTRTRRRGAGARGGRSCRAGHRGCRSCGRGRPRGWRGRPAIRVRASRDG